MDRGGSGSGEPGSSLVGVVLVVAILAGLAVVVVASLGSDGKVAGTVAGVGLTRPGDPNAPAAGGLPSAASVAACMADVATLEAAMAAANALRGSYPGSLAELQSSGFLSEQPERVGLSFAPETVEGKATGRILVNGRSADEGCH